jgi:integrase/recombinase XerD
MSNLLKDPVRRCMPFDEWPYHERDAWLSAITPGNLMDGTGPASHWKPLTIKKVKTAYGRWLTFLLLAGRLDSHGSPAQRCTEANLRAYVEMLRSQVTSTTLAGRMIDLEQAIKVMDPNADRTFLKTVACNLVARAKPTRDKRAKYVHPARIFRLGVDLMDRVANQQGHIGPRKASHYRDGLMFAMLATSHLRRGNLAHLVIGRHIQKHGSIYRLVFEPGETKGGRTFELSLPQMLSPHIESYLKHYRPLLLRSRQSDRFLITFLGTDFSGDDVYARVRKVSLREIGVALNPHAFRDGAATALAIEDPEHVLAARTILDHTDPRCTERYYNQAQMIDSARQFQTSVLEIRKLAAMDKKPVRQSRKS